MKIREFETHWAADRFPMHDREQFDELVESMRSVGFDPDCPVVVLGATILDGRNRMKRRQLAAKLAASRESESTRRAVRRWVEAEESLRDQVRHWLGGLASAHFSEARGTGFLAALSIRRAR